MRILDVLTSEVKKSPLKRWQLALSLSWYLCEISSSSQWWFLSPTVYILDSQDTIIDPILKQNEVESERWCRKVFAEVFDEYVYNVSAKAAEASEITTAQNSIALLWDGLESARKHYESRSSGPMKMNVWNKLSMQKMRPLCVDAYTTCCQLAHDTAQQLEESQGRCTAADAALSKERAIRLDLEGKINQHVLNLGARDTEILRLQGQLQNQEHNITRDKRCAESNQRALEQAQIDLNRCASERSKTAEQLAAAKRQILATKTASQALVSKLSSLRRVVFEMKQRIQAIRIQAVSKHTQFYNWLRDSKQNICSSVGQQIEAAQNEVDQVTATRRLKTQGIKHKLQNMRHEILSLRSNLDQIRGTILKNAEVSRYSSKRLFGSYSSKVLALTTHWSKVISDRGAHCQVP